MFGFYNYFSDIVMHVLPPSLDFDIKSSLFHEFTVCREFAVNVFAVEGNGNGGWERMLTQQNGANPFSVARLPPKNYLVLVMLNSFHVSP